MKLLTRLAIAAAGIAVLGPTGLAANAAPLAGHVTIRAFDTYNKLEHGRGPDARVHRKGKYENSYRHGRHGKIESSGLPTGKRMHKPFVKTPIRSVY